MNKLPFITALVLIAVCSSCEKYLDVQPYGVPTVENFYKTEEDALQAATAMYSPMRESISNENFANAQANDLIFGDVGTDDILKGGSNANDGPALFEKETYSLTAANANVQSRWKINYKGIFFCNLVLEKVPDISFTNAALKNRILGEARFMRAYYYFDLVKYFGDVPLVEEPLEASEYNLPRSPKEEIYALIDADLLEAVSVLPVRFTYANADIGRADRGAALGLMAKVAAFKGDMQKVKTTAEQIFAITQFRLTANFADIFQPTGEWNSESIWEISAGSFADNRGSLIARFIAPRNRGGVGFGQIKDDLRAAYAPNDPRLNASFYNVTGNPYGTNWYNRKYSYTPFSNYQRATVGGAVPNGPHNFRVIRLADIYLLYAEAVYASDPLLAIDYVNRVRRRARGSNPATVVPDLPSNLTGQNLLNAIYLERRLELSGEGHRFFDLIRTGRASTVLAPFGFKAGIHEQMPIPEAQISLSNGVLVQNNGY